MLERVFELSFQDIKGIYGRLMRIRYVLRVALEELAEKNRFASTKQGTIINFH